MTKTTAVLAAILAVIVAVGIVVGGYLGGWWIRKDVTNRQQRIDRQNYGTQLGYQTALNEKITEIKGIDVQLADPRTPSYEKAALSAQRKALVDAACAIHPNLTSEPANIAAWTSTNC
jgi:hypothetical protein